jgi:hypothetical protein
MLPASRMFQSPVLQSIWQICMSLDCLWWSGIRLEPIFTTASTALKNKAHFKNGQNWLKNNHLTSLVQIRDTFFGFSYFSPDIRIRRRLFLARIWFEGPNRRSPPCARWRTSSRRCRWWCRWSGCASRGVGPTISEEKRNDSLKPWYDFVRKFIFMFRHLW